MNPDSPGRDRYVLLAEERTTRIEDFGRDVRTGLGVLPKSIPCRYFYDHRGSLLFEEICGLREYYLTRAETEILHAHVDDLSGRFPTGAEIVELGSGSSAKTRIIIEAFLRRFGTLSYLPIDVSRTILEQSSLSLLESYPGLEIKAVAAPYEEGLRVVGRPTGPPRLVLWLGSSIGNANRPDAARFLERIGRTLIDGSRLLLGVDLRKDRETLERAYDDSRGVTARFNKNILERINRELGGRFDLSLFHHRAVYNERLGRIELSLVSEAEHEVVIRDLDLAVSFRQDEAIITEFSYKYSIDEIDDLAASARLRRVATWFDGRRRFALNLLAPACAT